MGGDTRHFVTLADDLKACERFRVRLINTSRGAEHSRIFRNLAVAFRTMLAVVVNLNKVDLVSYHASDRGMFMFGPIIVSLSRAFRKPAVLRVFGGSFGDFYAQQGTMKRAIIRRLVLSADAVLLQTHRSMRQLRTHARGNLVWFSTYRRLSIPVDHVEDRSTDTGVCSKFVFLGHLWRTKGIETLLEVAPHLPPGCSIDIFGPQDEYTEEDIQRRGLGRVRYGGFLTHDEVDRRLWDYDCLVLPTFHSGEGYPGVIVEAFAHALPVITTKWMAIPEIVDEKCGVLVEPNDVEGLADAIATLHQDTIRFRKLKQGARLKAMEFDHAVWSRKFEEICEELVQS